MKKIPRKKKSPMKTKHTKDGNFRNLREYQMFIPNQPSVSQVQGKSAVYLAVSDPIGSRERQNTSVSKSSARKLFQQSELKSMVYPEREPVNLRNQMNLSMNSSHNAVKQLSPSVPKTDKHTGKNPHVVMNRSVIQKQKTDESLGSYQANEVLTDRRAARPAFHKMLTQ